MTDEELVKSYLAEKNEQFLELLIGRYLPLVFGYVRKYTGNPDTASDITQEIFVKIWRNLKKFDRTKNFKAWLFTIAKNTVVDWFRGKTEIPFSTMEEHFYETIPDETPSILDIIQETDLSKKFSLALAQIPSRQSRVIKLHLNDSMNFKEISQVLKKSINTVKSQYRRGVLKLKEILSK